MVAPPTAVMPDVLIRKPLPLPSVHRMPVVDEAHVKGPRVIVCPYCKVGVPSAPFERHCVPVHVVTVLSVLRTADWGGEYVRHKVWVIELEPKSSSISQLMFFVGERNSEAVGVCGSSVPLVADVVVVLVCAVECDVVVDAGVDDVVERAVDDVVVEAEGVGPLEHDAIDAAPATRTTTGTRCRERKNLGIFGS